MTHLKLQIPAFFLLFNQCTNPYFFTKHKTASLIVSYTVMDPLQNMYIAHHDYNFTEHLLSVLRHAASSNMYTLPHSTENICTNITL